MSTSVTVAGSTGSIGVQTLEVIEAAADDYRVSALVAGRSWQALAEQTERVRPEMVVVADPDCVGPLRSVLDRSVTIDCGEDALRHACSIADVTINGIVGFAGLPATLATLEAGRRLGLANKESLIAAGPVVQRVRTTAGAEIVPVDSEHAALHQCLRSNRDGRQVARLQITASGGPFRGRSAADLATVTVDEALEHPTWSMGPKITVDSSTLMNKGLEVIEAVELFGPPAREHGYGVDFDHIDVVVHPQSVVHSMVTYADGSTIAQLSNPDMRNPIGYALSFPDRLEVPFGALDWTQPLQLSFEQPDRAAFRCLDLAFQAGRTGGTAPAWLSAANEVAVDAFLARRITWTQIADVVAETLDTHDSGTAATLDDVLDGDRRAREVAAAAVERRSTA